MGRKAPWLRSALWLMLARCEQMVSMVYVCTVIHKLSLSLVHTHTHTHTLEQQIRHGCHSAVEER